MQLQQSPCEALIGSVCSGRHWGGFWALENVLGDAHYCCGCSASTWEMLGWDAPWGMGSGAAAHVLAQWMHLRMCMSDCLLNVQSCNPPCAALISLWWGFQCRTNMFAHCWGALWCGEQAIIMKNNSSNNSSVPVIHQNRLRDWCNLWCLFFAQKTCPWEEEASTSSKYNPGDPSVHVLCPFAAWSLCWLSWCPSTEPEPQRDRPQPHALLGDEEVGGEKLVNVTWVLCPCKAWVWAAAKEQSMLLETPPRICSKSLRFWLCFHNEDKLFFLIITPNWSEKCGVCPHLSALLSLNFTTSLSTLLEME